MEEKLKYTSKFNGEDTDSILEGAKKVINAELPSLDEIGGFMVYDKEGKAIGLMSSEQVSKVVGGLLPIKRLSSEQKYPVNVPALSQVNIELKSEYTYLISVEYPYSESSALLYIPQTRHKICSITSDLPSGMVFSLGEDGNLVISSTNYPYGLKVTLLAF